MPTREAAWATPAPDWVIYDVGRDYNLAHLIFDRHQKNPLLRDKGQAYRTFGLIWRRFGRGYLQAFGVLERDLGAIYAAFDADFVLPIDLVDNGAQSPAGRLADLSLPLLLGSPSPPTTTAVRRQTPGPSAARGPSHVPSSRRQSLARLPSCEPRPSLWKATAAAGECQVLELPMGLPLCSAIEKAGAVHLLFVVHLRETDWAVTSIRREAEGLALRADLPEAWTGLTDVAFEAASGFPGARFCHNARFIAVAEDRKATLHLAALAVQSVEALLEVA